MGIRDSSEYFDEKEEINRRNASGNRAYVSLNNILKSRLVSKLTKFRLSKTLIRPILVYSDET